MNPALALIRRDLLVALRRRQETLWPLWFALLVVSLFPLGISPDPAILRVVGPGVIWIAMLLSGLLTLDPLFRADAEDGSLEQWLLGDVPLSLLAFARIVSHWLISGLPLVLVAPLMALMLGMHGDLIAVLLVSLLLGGPLLSALGATGAALALGARRGAFLVVLLVVPWYVPILIFASGALRSAADGLPAGPQLQLLAAMSLFGITLAPWAIAGALKINLKG